ncbi:MAG: metallophosphoesterase [Kiritimatiellae bacterium]|nr:metallophosphoesterase [Kiritimatiellia bacterium]
MNRREFIAGLAAAGAVANGRSADVAADATGRPFKVCVFSDLHYERNYWTNTENTSFLEKIMARAERERCDMMIHCGDFMHGVGKPWQKEFLKRYNDFKIPGYHVLGNHDQDQNPFAETCDAYRMGASGYYSFDKGGFRFVVADPNYFCPEPGKFVHHDTGNYFRAARKGATLNWIPPHELEWLRATLVGSPLPCVVLSHQSFERGNNVPVRNSDAVRAIFDEANAKKPGTVRLVMNGHLHIDNLRVIDSILYWDVNSANYRYYGPVHEKYPESYVKTHPGASHTLGWTEPLSGILTLWPNGRIKIEGAKSDWLFGVKPADAGYPKYDADGRESHPAIQSADMTFNYA